MNATLLLNASYEPLRIISWKKALTLLFAGKVEVIDEYDHQVHAITFAIKLLNLKTPGRETDPELDELPSGSSA